MITNSDAIICVLIGVIMSGLIFVLGLAAGTKTMQEAAVAHGFATIEGQVFIWEKNNEPNANVK